MKKVIIILVAATLSCGGQHIFAQINREKFDFTTEKFDSVTIAYGIDYNKENSLPNDKIERDTFILKSVARLSKSEIKKLHQWFLSEKAFSDTTPLPSHGDIVISYHKNDTVVVRCTVSSLTGKITFASAERYFASGITPAFEKYLTALMRKKKLWRKKEGFSEF